MKQSKFKIFWAIAFYFISDLSESTGELRTQKPKPDCKPTAPESNEQLPGVGVCNLCLLLCDSRTMEDGDTLEAGVDFYPEKGNGTTRRDSSRNSNDAIVGPCSYEDEFALLDGIERTIGFYENNLHKFNQRTDGGIGLAILYQQLDHLMTFYKEKLTQERFDKFRSLRDKGKFLSYEIFKMAKEAELNIDSSRTHELDIMGNSSRMLQARRHWRSRDLISKYKDAFPNIGKEPEVVEPYLDFKCLAAVADNCKIPTVCRKMYLEDIYSQYMLVHQIIYMSFAEKNACFGTNEPSGNPTFGGYNTRQEMLCAKAYQEATFIANAGYPIRWRDLFAEQVSFCAMAGFPNFLRSDWMQEILQWQTKNSQGCFWDVYEDKRINDAIIPVAYDQGGQQIKENCLVHLTSVGLGALAMNLAYAVSECEN